MQMQAVFGGPAHCGANFWWEASIIISSQKLYILNNGYRRSNGDGLLHILHNFRLELEEWIIKEKATRDQCAAMIKHECAKWKQHAKLFWLRYGDMNTKYFHSQASHLGRRNYAQMMGLGFVTRWDLGVTNLVRNYFSELLKGVESDISPIVSCIRRSITDEDNELLL
ncbi:hypothetical protein ACFE04_001840 [Oxalis oulophora]